jgi:hypothetical protein
MRDMLTLLDLVWVLPSKPPVMSTGGECSCKTWFRSLCFIETAVQSRLQALHLLTEDVTGNSSSLVIAFVPHIHGIRG